jgi:hypothetical protein
MFRGRLFNGWVMKREGDGVEGVSRLREEASAFARKLRRDKSAHREGGSVEVWGAVLPRRTLLPRLSYGRTAGWLRADYLISDLRRREAVLGARGVYNSCDSCDSSRSYKLMRSSEREAGTLSRSGQVQPCPAWSKWRGRGADAHVQDPSALFPTSRRDKWSRVISPSQAGSNRVQVSQSESNHLREKVRLGQAGSNLIPSCEDNAGLRGPGQTQLLRDRAALTQRSEAQGVVTF